MKSLLIPSILIVALTCAPAAFAGETASDEPSDWLTSLVTDTPAEGFALALRLARRGVTSTQPDREVLMREREKYAEDGEDLIAASHVVAVHFQTIAAANNYWRD